MPISDLEKGNKMETNSILNKMLFLFTVLFQVVSLSIPLVATAETDAPDLAAWLTEHPLISQTIRWQDSNGTKVYADWSEAQKADLLEMYQKVWNGQPLGLTDPPPNMLDLEDGARFTTVLSKDHAWSLFLALVAYGFAVETGERVPWSLTEYSQEELLELFDGSKMFSRKHDMEGYEVIYFGMPAPPDFSFQFLSDNNMIAQDRLQTIGNLLTWCRYKMTHFTGWFTAKNAEDHWQYRGVTPISRVISGTTFYSDFWNAELFSHYTGGCWGTTAFLREVLRVVNIPVKNAPAGGHALPYFISESKYLSHGDDPYNWNIRSSSIPIEELFIDQATYNAWYGPNIPSEKQRQNVGRQSDELDKHWHPDMYWVNTEAGTLHRLPQMDATPAPFVPSVQNATSLAVDVAGSKVYWTEKMSSRTGRIRRANFDGTNIQEIKSLTSVPLAIAIDTSNKKIYVTNPYGKVQRLNIDGSNFEPNLITDLESPQNLALHAGKVYWTEAAKHIRRANFDGTNVETVVSATVSVDDIAFWGRSLFWTERTNENSGKIKRAYLNGDNIQTIVTLMSIPHSIGVDDMHFDFDGHKVLIYWTNSRGKMQRANTEGKNVQNIITGLTAPKDLALVYNPRPVLPESYRPPIYWINTQAGTLHRLTGSLVEHFVPSARNVTSLAADIAGGKVYWTEKTSHNTGKIRRANFDGTNIKDVKSFDGVPHGMAIDAENKKIYVTNSLGKIQRMNFDGSSFQPNLVKSLVNPKDIALSVVGGKVYWTEDSRRIRRANLDGSNIQTITTVSGPTGSIVVAGDKLYWTEKPNKYDGYIKRAFLDGKKVERLGSFISPLVGIAVDTKENKIYWTDELGKINSGHFPISSGESKQRYLPISSGRTLVTGLTAPGSLVLGGDMPEIPMPEFQHPAMYWTGRTNGTLHRFAGSGVENLLPNIRNVTGLAVDVAEEKIYWVEKTTNRTGKIQRANLNGSNVELVKSLTSAPHGIAIDTTHNKLYITNSWGKIQRLNFDGSNFETDLITGLNTLKNIVLDIDGGKLYWTEKTSNRTGKIQRANLNGSNVELVKSLSSVPLSLAIDSANRKLYLTNSWGKIQRLNFDGSNFETDFITGLEFPEGIAVDVYSGKIYWTETDGINCASLNGENIQNIVMGLSAPANIVLGIAQTHTSIAAAPVAFVAPIDETQLYPNYPNPFNPETWIPYQLSKHADVTLCIYSVNGTVVRTLALGHQPPGIYHSKSRAAYWDGKNDVGEPVASGIYFYTLSTESTRDSVTAGEFTATRKMLIRK